MAFDIKHLIIFLALWLAAKPSTAAPHDRQVDSLLLCIDEAIGQSATYVRQKEERIARLKGELAQAKTTESRLQLTEALAEEYVPFVNDSCIYYLNLCGTLADQLGLHSKAGGFRAHAALMYSNAGIFLDGISTLEAIDSTQLAGADLGMYYFAYAHIYSESAYYARSDDQQKHYYDLARSYQDKAYRYLPSTNMFVWQHREMDDLNNHRYAKSMRTNDAWLASVNPSSHEYALVTFYRFFEYQAVGDTVQMMRWLAESVLSDVRQGVMDQGSLWEMANQLYGMGDIDRAYSYITYANDCANRFGSRQRLWRISPLMNDIAREYKAEGETYNQRLRFALMAISVMLVLLLLSLLYVNKQRRRLRASRNDLKDANDKLTASRDALEQANSQLTEFNALLDEANHVKEEYVGHFMRLCSLYIDKLDDLRKMVNKKVKNHQYEELYEQTRTSRFKQEELDGLYAHFDKAFLRLFPTFVEEFNALLRPEEQVEQPDRDRLTTVLRIFALIRLGICDSSKIAEFLHYSVNTIYNYRAQVKKGAVDDRDTFEERVRCIGRPSCKQ